MSRTYRRRKSGRSKVDYSDYVYLEDIEDFSQVEEIRLPRYGYSWSFGKGYRSVTLVDITYKKNSKTGKKIRNIFHSDKVRVMNDPMWWYRLHQACYRAKCRNEIQKFLKNPEYEVVLELKPRVPWYW